MQGLADVVEPVAGTVERQQFFQIGLYAEQVADRVLVLDAIESAQDRSSLCSPGGVRRFEP